MAVNNCLIIDIATAPLETAAVDLANEPIDAPANYKDPEKIAAYIATKRAELVSKAALDPHSGRISAIGFGAVSPDGIMVFSETQEHTSEAELVMDIRGSVGGGRVLVGFNSRAFDWHFLNTRAFLLGVPGWKRITGPAWKSPHIDIYEELSGDVRGRAKSLGFYAKLLWPDLVKPLDGAEEAKVFETGNWAGLEKSLEHDVTVTYRLAQRLGVIEQEPVL